MHDDEQHGIDRRLLLARGGAAIAALCAIPRIGSAQEPNAPLDDRLEPRLAVRTMNSLDNMATGESRTIGETTIRWASAVVAGIMEENRTAQIVPCDPTTQPFRPQMMIVFGTPENWRIRDVLIGGRSQLSKAGLRAYRDGIPGEILACTSDRRIADHLIGSFDVVEAGEAVTAIVTYLGAHDAPFVCGIVGQHC